MADVRRSMMLLRYDALERGMMDIAIVYGWSAMRIGSEMLKSGAVFNDPNVCPIWEPRA